MTRHDSGRRPRDRWNRGGWLLRDETLRRLEILLDEAFVVPGTTIRFGLSGIVGLVPGLGDALAGVLSLAIPWAGWVRGLPYVALARMGINIAIAVMVGAVPVFGDLFDILWKVNHRNYRLLARHLQAPRRHTWRDWVFLLVLAGVLALILAMPVVLVIWAVWALFRR